MCRWQFVVYSDKLRTTNVMIGTNSIVQIPAVMLFAGAMDVRTRPSGQVIFSIHNSFIEVETDMDTAKITREIRDAVSDLLYRKCLNPGLDLRAWTPLATAVVQYVSHAGRLEI
jgi:hypothetical protein